MPQILVPDYIASAQQSKFHSSTAFETLYGGAAGGGKSVALCAEAITCALEQANTRVYIFRRTLPELYQSIYPEVLRQLAPYQSQPDSRKDVLISFNGQKHTFSFTNGSFIQFAYLDTVADRYRYMSAEIHVLLIDELTHFHYDDYEYLRTRVRSGDDRRLKIMSATNPGNVGHGWVKEYFGLPNGVPTGTILTQANDAEGNLTTETRLFIPAKVDDNPSENFRVTYKRTLNNIKDENLRRAQRDGDWSVFQGQVFLEWHKNNPIFEKLPAGLKLADCDKFIGFDWGWRDPAVAVWLARAPENEFGVRHLYAYREIHESQRTPKWWGETIADIIKDEPVEYMVLPHDCFSSQQGHRTIASIFGDFDIPYVRADSMNHAAKMHRITILHEYLAMSDDGTPTLQFHKTNMINSVRTIPDLPYSDTRPEEINDKADDHDYDAVTYALMVIDDQESWLVSPNPPKDKHKETPYYGGPNGTVVGNHIDIGAALNENQERDWRIR